MTDFQKILVTGSAGFIGFHLCQKLLNKGLEVKGIDSLNDYYDVSLKQKRNEILSEFPTYTFYHEDLVKESALNKIFSDEQPEVVVNMAAQAGVRYSLTHPHVYINSNIKGFLNILECCRHHQVKHLVYASSSSVYGANTNMPFKVSQNVDHPLSLYAATKKSNELMAHTYSSSFGIPTTGLRFFTVYGPWGRPDMALFLFTKAILNDEPINVFNYGKMNRDFTYIDDIVEGICRLIPSIPTKNSGWNSHSPDPSYSFAPYKLFNIGNNSPVELMDYIKTLEEMLGKSAEINFEPIQIGDVPEIYADVGHLEEEIGYRPSTTIQYGVKKFVEWYKGFYKI